MEQKLQQRTAVKIGNILSSQLANVSEPGCRTQQQHDAIMNWHREYPSAFWCINPFEPEADGKVFNCSFCHMYVSANAKLWVIKVTPTGKVSKAIQVGSFSRDMDVIKTIATFGVFLG